MDETRNKCIIEWFVWKNYAFIACNSSLNIIISACSDSIRRRWLPDLTVNVIVLFFCLYYWWKSLFFHCNNTVPESWVQMKWKKKTDPIWTKRFGYFSTVRCIERRPWLIWPILMLYEWIGYKWVEFQMLSRHPSSMSARQSVIKTSIGMNKSQLKCRLWARANIRSDFGCFFFFFCLSICTQLCEPNKHVALQKPTGVRSIRMISPVSIRFNSGIWSKFWSRFLIHKISHWQALFPLRRWLDFHSSRLL